MPKIISDELLEDLDLLLEGTFILSQEDCPVRQAACRLALWLGITPPPPRDRFIDAVMGRINYGMPKRKPRKAKHV